MRPRRPILRYHGGKWRLAPWIISHFPRHRVYVEPFGGAASVLLRKRRVYSEVYNDLDGEVVNLFRVVRDHAERLATLIHYTPFARDEYRRAFDPTNDVIEMAYRTVCRSFMGFGSNSINRDVKSGFRANANRSGTTPAHDWASFPENVLRICDRLRGVVIENRPALEVIAQQDGPDTLHYCDPPYVHSTRGEHGYACEMTDGDHEALAGCLGGVRGMVMLSGYHSALYEALYAGWNSIEREAFADGAANRTEVLWFNAAAWDALTGERNLFAQCAMTGGKDTSDSTAGRAGKERTS